MLWYLRLDFASAQPSRIGAEYVDCTSRIGAEWGAEFAELPSIIRRGLAIHTQIPLTMKKDYFLTKCCEKPTVYVT